MSGSVRSLPATLPPVDVRAVGQTSSLGSMHALQPAPALPPAAVTALVAVLPSLADAPSLVAPASFDFEALMSQFLSIRTKLGDEQVKTGLEDVKHNSAIRSALDKQESKDVADADAKNADAAGSELAGTIFGWIAEILGAVATIATGGAAAAAVLVVTETLDKTGVLDKLTQGIESVLEDMGLSKEWATGLATAYVGALCLIAGGMGAAASIKTAAKSGVATIESLAARVVRLGSTVGQGLATLGQTGAGIGNAVQNKQVADLQADQMEVKKARTQVQAQIDDGIDFIRAGNESNQALTKKVLEMMAAYEDTCTSIIRHNG